MNNGKLCVSVCAKTADEFIQKIKKAGEIADVIELRFDCINDLETGNLFRVVKNSRKFYNGKYLVTYRSEEQGGKKKLSLETRKEFWLDSHIFEFVEWADLEEDISEETINALWGKAFQKVIKSHHIFSNNHDLLLSKFEKLSSEAKTVKLAVQANKITDSIQIWKLLKKAKLENKKLIPIAMGEAGKWTRILGLAYGSPMTYASLEEGNETAPGQISAKDLIEVYRVKELDKQSGIYGVVGNPVMHSLSPYMHNAAFNHHGLNAVYIPFEVSNLDEFIKRMVREETREIEWNLKGFSVTIPHKETIIKHLDFVDEDAEAIGAVNTVKIFDGKLHGYNTDAHGFIEPLKTSYGDLKDANIGIIGNGGAARACIYALKKEGANVKIFARNPEKAESFAKEFEAELFDLTTQNSKIKTQNILINTTPLGTIGELENETPATSEQLKNLHMAYDLVYNPFETLFMREAKSVDVPTLGGLAMLVAQGMKQFEIWTGLEAPMQEMSRAALQRLK